MLLQKCFLALISVCLLLQPAAAQSLQISKNGRYLQTAEGKPFFYLGDTAWELFHRLNREEAIQYLDDRKAKGFTVIQAVVLPQLGWLKTPNAAGHLPLVDKDPTRPNRPYFEHVDFVVREANKRGLIVGMLPTWGTYWDSDGKHKIFTKENARTFGEYVGKRYREASLIWILGGDQNILTEEERQIIEAMAGGLETGDGGRHLMTFHPRGPGLSSDYVHTASWLDFNMVQSSHGAHNHDNGLYAAHDYALEPVKPTLDGEPRYERIPTGFYIQGANPQDRFDDWDVRQAAYWSVLAGACGHTYGHNSIWQMHDKGRQGVIGAMIPWHEALNHPGGHQMRHVRTLFEARPWWQLVPDQSWVLDAPDQGGAKVRASLAADSSFAVLYTPMGAPVTVNQGLIKSDRLRAIWFDPRYGVSYPFFEGDVLGIQTYTPPTSGRGQDWVLILEDGEQGMGVPGR